VFGSSSNPTQFPISVICFSWSLSNDQVMLIHNSVMKHDNLAQGGVRNISIRANSSINCRSSSVNQSEPSS